MAQPDAHLSHYWLVAVPNEQGQNADKTYTFIREKVASRANDLAECSRFNIPMDLLVGTLDSLMALSDELGKVDQSIDAVVKKIERQFKDLNNQNEEILTVDGVPVERYLANFNWDEAKHPHRRPLPEIVKVIQATIGKVEEELKQLNQTYMDTKQQLNSLTKKKGGNLMSANLDDVLTPGVVSKDDFVNTEYLSTQVVIVPKNLEKEWLAAYENLGQTIANYGPEGRRDQVKGSPVVPGSARKLVEDTDFIVYTCTLLRGQYRAGFVDEEGTFEHGAMVDYIEDFKKEAREKRFVVRDFTFNPNAHEENVKKTAKLEVDVDRLWSGLVRWCKAHFGEAFIAWVHIKAIRLFVESVLRFGLPVNFAAALLKPHKNKDKKLRDALNNAYSHLEPGYNPAGAPGGKEEALAGVGGEFYPYVFSTMAV